MNFQRPKALMRKRVCGSWNHKRRKSSSPAADQYPGVTWISIIRLYIPTTMAMNRRLISNYPDVCRSHHFRPSCQFFVLLVPAKYLPNLWMQAYFRRDAARNSSARCAHAATHVCYDTIPVWPALVELVLQAVVFMPLVWTHEEMRSAYSTIELLEENI